MDRSPFALAGLLFPIIFYLLKKMFVCSASAESYNSGFGDSLQMYSGSLIKQINFLYHERAQERVVLGERPDDDIQGGRRSTSGEEIFFTSTPLGASKRPWWRNYIIQKFPIGHSGWQNDPGLPLTERYRCSRNETVQDPWHWLFHIFVVDSIPLTQLERKLGKVQMPPLLWTLNSAKPPAARIMLPLIQIQRTELPNVQIRIHLLSKKELEVRRSL
jgi:hypothetical protein